jgi:signal transduction histidine kinase
LKAGIGELGKLKSSVSRRDFGIISGILAASRPDKAHALVLMVDASRLKDLRWRGVLLISLLILASVISVIFLMSKHLVLPILERLELLKDSLARFGSGKRDARLDTCSRAEDEFDEVFQGFNSMAEKICRYEKEKARMAKEEKTLLAQLAHDINTPIAILRANAENLNVYGESLDLQARWKIQTDILAQCLYIQSLVDDLLTMASAKLAQISVNPGRVMLDDLFDSIIDTFGPVVDQKGIVLLADGNELSVWADPVRTRQILTNLVKNSIVHGGKRLSLIEIEAKEKGDMVSIVIKDDGRGIAQKDIDRLLKDFQQGIRAGTRGWGLGLAIVKMLAELQGGKCLYRGSQGGAVFEILLPGCPKDNNPGSVK